MAQPVGIIASTHANKSGIVRFVKATTRTSPAMSPIAAIPCVNRIIS